MANLMAIYLNDHLGASVAGIELAKRCRSNNRTGALADYLDTFIGEIEEDHLILQELIDRIGARKDPLKLAAGLVAERLGRLKPNGTLLGYSDLSRFEELEGLAVGAEAQGAMWRALAAVAAGGDGDGRLEGFDLDRLARRAARQHEELEAFRVEAGKEALRA
jgi:hypothetical protein